MNANSAMVKIEWNSISKESLTTLVWSKPSSEISTSLGIHESVIRNKCRKLQVIKPSSKFWANVKKGFYKHPEGVQVKNKRESEIDEKIKRSPLFNKWEFLSSKELEKLIWKRPTTQLAKEFGISETAIRNRCKDFCIEKPPLGFWRKVETGLIKHPMGKPIRIKYTASDNDVFIKIKEANIYLQNDLNEFNFKKINNDKKIELLWQLDRKTKNRLDSQIKDPNIKRMLVKFKESGASNFSVIGLFKSIVHIKSDEELAKCLGIKESELVKEYISPSLLTKLRILKFINPKQRRAVEKIERCLESNDYMIKTINAHTPPIK